MPAHPFVTTDVFTSQRFGGNQLAVFPHGERIDPALMQRIAREFNFSETTFVLPPDHAAHTRRVRIFTPDRELPFAGHPTVGTAVVLAHLGEITVAGDETRIVFEEGVGPVPVLVRRSAAGANWAQLSAAKLPEFGAKPPSAADLARVLSLEPSDVLDGALAPQARPTRRSRARARGILDHGSVRLLRRSRASRLELSRADVRADARRHGRPRDRKRVRSVRRISGLAGQAH
jgi:PhzF family phenazine biosynthesis protein